MRSQDQTLVIFTCPMRMGAGPTAVEDVLETQRAVLCTQGP